MAENNCPNCKSDKEIQTQIGNLCDILDARIGILKGTNRQKKSEIIPDSQSEDKHIDDIVNNVDALKSKLDEYKNLMSEERNLDKEFQLRQRDRTSGGQVIAQEQGKTDSGFLSQRGSALSDIIPEPQGNCNQITDDGTNMSHAIVVSGECIVRDETDKESTA